MAGKYKETYRQYYYKVIVVEHSPGKVPVHVRHAHTTFARSVGETIQQVINKYQDLSYKTVNSIIVKATSQYGHTLWEGTRAEWYMSATYQHYLSTRSGPPAALITTDTKYKDEDKIPQLSSSDLNKWSSPYYRKRSFNIAKNPEAILS